MLEAINNNSPSADPIDLSERFWRTRLEQNQAELQTCKDPERRKIFEDAVLRAKQHLGIETDPWADLEALSD